MKGAVLVKSVPSSILREQKFNKTKSVENTVIYSRKVLHNLSFSQDIKHLDDLFNPFATNYFGKNVSA